MYAPTCAVELVDVRHALGCIGLAGIPRLYFVVLWVTAAGRYLLVLLQRLDVLGRDQAVQLGNRIAGTG
jgi:hypothetical protein